MKQRERIFQEEQWFTTATLKVCAGGMGPCQEGNSYVHRFPGAVRRGGG